MYEKVISIFEKYQVIIEVAAIGILLSLGLEICIRLYGVYS
jgi:hypothetical protein